MIETFTHETFAPRQGEPFHLRFSDGSIETRLLESRTWGTGSGDSRQPFRLTFRGPLQPAFRQGTYRVEHEEIGAFDLFLVPVGPDEDGMRYEAVFS